MCIRDRASTLLQTDNHTSTPPLSFLQAGCPTNSVKALKANIRATGLLKYIHTHTHAHDKGKINGPYSTRQRRRVLICLSRPWARRWINHLSLWRMASATPDLWLPSQTQGITTPWLVPNYTAWWQRHVCVNNLPKVESGTAGSRTRARISTKPESCPQSGEPWRDKITHTRGMPTDKPRSIPTASSADGISTGLNASVTVVESYTSCPANVSAT